MRLLAILLVAGTLAAAGPEVKEFTKTLPLKPDTLVALQAERGNVEITGWDQPALEIHARIEMEQGMFKSKYAVQDTEIKVEATEGAVQIRADYSKVQQSSWSMLAGGSVHPVVHYQLKVARGSRLRVRNEGGSVNIQNIRGDVDFETVHGDGKFAGLEGPVRMKTVFGDIELRMNKAAGPSIVETIRGSVTIYLPAKAKFNIEPEAGRSAEITSDFGATAGQAVKEATKVNGGGPSYRVTVRHGTVAFKKI